MRLTRSLRIATHTLLVVAMLSCVLLVGSVAHAQIRSPASLPNAQAASQTVRFRLRVSSQEPKPFSASLVSDQGAFRDLRGTSNISSLEAGLSSDARSVSLSSAAEHLAAETILTFEGDLSEAIRLKIQGNGNAEAVSIPLHEIYAGGVTRSIGDLGITAEFERLAEDRLRIETDHPSAIFAAGETFNLQLTAALADLEPQTPLNLLVQLLRVGDGRAVWQTSSQVSVPVDGLPRVESAIPLPNVGGDYLIRIVATQPAGFRKRFLPLAKNKPLAVRTVPIAVVSQDAPSGQLSFQTLIDIDPASPRWWERIPSWAWPRRLPWRYRAMFSHGALEVVESNSSAFVQIPAETDGDAAWQAIPLPVADPGTAHVLEVEYPADQPQQLVLAMLDSNSQGSYSPLGAAAEVVTQTWGSSNGKVRRYRRVFWPRSQSPLLLVSNGSTVNIARFGKVRLLRSSGRLPKKTAGDSLARFSASFDAASLRQTLCSTASNSQAFQAGDYEMAQRLADYAEAAAYDSVLLKVDATQLQPSVETGPQATLVEVVAEVLAKRGIGLTPVLRLGQTPENKALPSSFAQRAVTRGVENLLNRLDGKASLQAIGIALSPDSLAALPAERQGVTPASVDALLKAYDSSWPEKIGRTPAAEQELMLGPWKEAYASWRQTEFTKFYAELSERIETGRSGTKLLLFADSLLMESELATNLRPTLPANPEVSAILSRRGISINELAKHKHLQLVLPKFDLAANPLASRSLETEWNELLASEAEVQKLAILQNGSQRPFRLNSFEQRSPYGQASTDANFRLTAVADVTAKVDPLLYSKAESSGLLWQMQDSESQALSLSDQSIELRRQVALLPKSSRIKISKAQGPLHVTVASTAGGTLLYVQNRSPWRLDVSATLLLEDSTYSEQLYSELSKEEASKRTFYEAGEHISPMVIQAQGMAVYRFGGDKLAGVNCRFEYPAVVQEEFATQIERLERLSLNQQRPFLECGNLSFEESTSDGALQGWEALVRSSVGQLSLSSQSPRDGASAVVLEGYEENARVKLQSKAFLVPETGQLAMTFAVRAAAVDPSTKLIVRFATEDGSYDSFTTIQAASLQQVETGEWAPFAFGVEDLPTESPSGLRVLFELRGKGQLAIDDLEMHSLVYPLDCYAGRAAKQKLALLRVIHNAQAAYEAGRYDQCRTVLDSYWGQFLLTYVPLGPADSKSDSTAEPVSVAQRPPSATDAPEKPASTPSFSERVKGYWPSFFR